VYASHARWLLPFEARLFEERSTDRQHSSHRAQRGEELRTSEVRGKGGDRRGTQEGTGESLGLRSQLSSFRPPDAIRYSEGRSN